MKKVVDLQAMTETELIAHYIEIALAQDEAMLLDRISLYNKLYGQMDSIREELKSRPGDRRLALMDLYRHPNAQVRLKAATHTLAVAPVEARAVLQEIVDRKQFPQAGHAGMLLLDYDRGVCKPT